MINAETQLMYSSDYPHWDFDLPCDDLRSAVPVGEGQAQHPRRHRGAAVQAAAAQREAEGQPEEVRQSHRRGLIADDITPSTGGLRAARLALTTSVLRHASPVAMQRSTKRILTTHTGSLPRPEALTQLYVKRSRGEPVDAEGDRTARSGRSTRGGGKAARGRDRHRQQRRAAARLVLSLPAVRG